MKRLQACIHVFQSSVCQVVTKRITLICDPYTQFENKASFRFIDCKTDHVLSYCTRFSKWSFEKRLTDHMILTLKIYKVVRKWEYLKPVSTFKTKKINQGHFSNKFEIRIELDHCHDTSDFKFVTIRFRPDFVFIPSSFASCQLHLDALLLNKLIFSNEIFRNSTFWCRYLNKNSKLGIIFA